jgi:hypothetical protein
LAAERKKRNRCVRCGAPLPPYRRVIDPKTKKTRREKPTRCFACEKHVRSYYDRPNGKIPRLERPRCRHGQAVTVEAICPCGMLRHGGRWTDAGAVRALSSLVLPLASLAWMLIYANGKMKPGKKARR